MLIGAFLLIVICGFIIPERITMPVQHAGAKDYDKRSFWFYPWGKSVVHKGVDIFAVRGTPVLSSTYGLVLYTGHMGRGGNVVCILGPKWRMHYYAYLNEIKTSRFSFVHSGNKIGTVGNTGNAAGKPSHLHYSIITFIPYPWRMDLTHQGYKKMFYLNPVEYL